MKRAWRVERLVCLVVEFAHFALAIEALDLFQIVGPMSDRDTRRLWTQALKAVLISDGFESDGCQ